MKFSLSDYRQEERWMSLSDFICPHVILFSRLSFSQKHKKNGLQSDRQNSTDSILRATRDIKKIRNSSSPLQIFTSKYSIETSSLLLIDPRQMSLTLNISNGNRRRFSVFNWIITANAQKRNRQRTFLLFGKKLLDRSFPFSINRFSLFFSKEYFSSSIWLRIRQKKRKSRSILNSKQNKCWNLRRSLIDFFFI